MHESYKRPYGLAHDIALLKLERPAAITRYVQTVCVPDGTPESLPDNKKCWITGMSMCVVRYMSLSRLFSNFALFTGDIKQLGQPRSITFDSPSSRKSTWVRCEYSIDMPSIRCLIEYHSVVVESHSPETGNDGSNSRVAGCIAHRKGTC